MYCLQGIKNTGVGELGIRILYAFEIVFRSLYRMKSICTKITPYFVVYKLVCQNYLSDIPICNLGMEGLIV